MNGYDFHLTETSFTVAHYHPIPIALFLILVAFIVILPYWKIFGKAGFPSVLGLLMVIPLVNLILLYVVAFSPWKVLPDQSETNR
jgi:hypothetical protein